MKRSLLALLALLAILAMLAGCRNSVPALAPEQTYLRAVHWFGHDWAINFWQTDLESRAREDFENIKSDGFNTIILLVPWPGFAPDPRSGALDDSRVARLLRLMRLAGEMDLNVILRVSYAHDASGDELDRRSHQVWMDDDYHRGWLDYHDSLWAAVGDEPNLLFAFFSWEDLWGYVGQIGESGASERHMAAQQSGFGRWLSERYSLEEASARFGRVFTAWEQVGIPQRREPAFELFLEFIDHLWIERFFLPAQQRFPKISMEIRIDSDPVWDGEELVKWHHHRQAWNLPGADWVTLYWSPAMGGENQGESLSPEIAAERLESWLEEVSAEIGPRQIFISQFLVEDFTPGFEHNGHIPGDRVPEFLVLSGEVLSRLTGGYGLWTWRDYGHNMIDNPEFHVGLEQWLHSEAVSVTAGGARLEAGEWIAFSASTKQPHTPGERDAAELCVTGRSLADGSGGLQIHDRLNEQALGEIEFADGRSTECLVVDLASSMLIELSAVDGAVVSKVEHVGFVQESGMRYRHGEPKEVADAYRALNARLAGRNAGTDP